MKKLALLTLFLCLSFSFAGFADAETENWCGTYFEEGGRGYIRLARDDFGVGSSTAAWTATTNGRKEAVPQISPWILPKTVLPLTNGANSTTI